MVSKEPHREVRRLKRLEDAWRRVRDNGRKSRSKRTRAEVDEYGANVQSELRSIQNQLSRDAFRFDPSRGWAEPPKEKGKSHRPIVITPVRSRIVQRAILDVLLGQPAIQNFLDRPYSFGGVKKTDPEAAGAVPGAIHAAVGEILAGRTYFARSDISGFFRQIPKKFVCDKIREAVQDQKFCDLIEAAIDVEIENLDEIRQHEDLFPLQDIGVAQGCALSPLLGNILLSDFDKRLNGGDCVCIRYIDDFLILGPSVDAVREAFELANKLLSEFGMKAYSPEERPDKAEAGNVDVDKLTFLGVEIVNGSIRPSSKNRGKLLQSVKEVIDDHLKGKPTDEVGDTWDYSRSFIRCYATINAVVAGWGNQYYFCNDRKIFDDLDRRISESLAEGFKKFRDGWSGAGYLARRRLMGVRSLHDCRVEPIQWKKK